MSNINPNDYIITRKRKLYKFAVFQTLDNCYDDSNWDAAKDQILDQGKPITIEIGAGSGLFLTKLAEQHPNRQYIAIDRKSDRLQHGGKLAAERKLDNIIFLWTNAQKLADLFPARIADELWITFPDPWPQESNIKHRLTNQKYLAEYANLLADSGRLNFKTDNRPLFDWSTEQLADNWQIDYLTHNLHDETDKTVNSINSDARIMTSYEERYTSEGININYLIARPRRTVDDNKI